MRKCASGAPPRGGTPCNSQRAGHRCSGSGCRKSTARCRRGRGCLARWFVRIPFEHQLYQRPMQQIPGSPHATIQYPRHDVLPRCRTKLGVRCGIGQSSPIWLWWRNASDYIMNICPISNNNSSQPTMPRDPGIRRAFSSPASMVTTSSARSSSPVGAGSLTPSWPRSVEPAPATTYSTSVVGPGVSRPRSPIGRSVGKRRWRGPFPTDD
jgi:hypothetical protein